MDPRDGRDYVRWAYRLLLGREPESERAVEENPFRNDRLKLLQQFLHGREFLERHGVAFAVPPDLSSKGIANQLSKPAPEPGQVASVAQQVSIRQRPFHESRAGRRIIAMIEAGRPGYRFLCEAIAQNREWYQRIPVFNDGSADQEPAWANDTLPALDAMLLYTLVVLRNPAMYLEVGSGQSTRFVRRAILDHDLRTRIVSVDPCPSAGTEGLCDKIVRKPIEELSEGECLEDLSREDILLFDGSHRSFQNSDSTVFFTEVLPLIPPSVIYGIRNVFLPADYPGDWADRLYNEQYLLVSYLLGGAGGDKIAFPGIFASLDPDLRSRIDLLQSDSRFRSVPKHADTFWMQRGEQPDSQEKASTKDGGRSERFTPSLDQRTPSGMFLSEIAFLKRLGPRCRILDVGCGNNSSRAIKSVLPECHYTGIDVGDYNQTLPTVADKYILAAPEKFAEEIYKMKEQFDGVISTHNIEHCDEREKTIDAIAKAVKPGGALYMLFPSETSASLPSRGGCLNYFDDGTHKGAPPKFDELLDIVKSNGLQIVFAEREYRPFADSLRGLINESESIRRDMILPGTWSYYGFEALVWAEKRR